MTRVKVEGYFFGLNFRSQKVDLYPDEYGSSLCVIDGMRSLKLLVEEYTS